MDRTWKSVPGASANFSVWTGRGLAGVPVRGASREVLGRGAARGLAQEELLCQGIRESTLHAQCAGAASDSLLRFRQAWYSVMLSSDFAARIRCDRFFLSLRFHRAYAREWNLRTASMEVGTAKVEGRICL